MKPCLTEYEEMKTFVQYLELKGLLFSKIAQETYTPSWGQKVKNKMSGLRKGVPDMMIVLPSKLLFVEMKRVSGGITSPEQLEWLAALDKIPNVRARVCKGAEAAIDFMKEEMPLCAK